MEYYNLEADASWSDKRADKAISDYFEEYSRSFVRKLFDDRLITCNGMHHWFGWPASVITPVLDISCYLLALKVLGPDFIKWSVASTLCVSGFFRLWETWPPFLPDLSGQPLLAAVLGALFVGVGVGLIVRQGGSSGGDDALALSIAKAVKCRISHAYLFTDLTVLTLSLSYIPFKRIAYSLITVTLSSWIIDCFQKGKKNT